MSWRTDEVAMADGTPVRVGVWQRPAADRPALARLVLWNGRADFLEKWSLAVEALAALGCDVAAWDWRGQGLSGGKPASGAGHVPGFDLWLDDADRLMRWAAEALPGKAPLAPLGHSMGGHLLLRWLARHGRAAPAGASAAVLVAPLIRLVAGGGRRAGAARWVARRQVALGLGERLAWGQAPGAAQALRGGRQALLTHSDAHYAAERDALVARPELGTGGVSWGWLAALADSQAALEQADLAAIDLPTLWLVAGADRLVSNRAIQQTAARVPRAERAVIEGARHELLREAEPWAGRALSRLADFLARAAA